MAMAGPLDERDMQQLSEALALTVYDYKVGQAEVTEGHGELEVEETFDDFWPDYSSDNEAVPPILYLISDDFASTRRMDWSYMRGMAEAAAECCETARVAVDEASRAGARMFLEAAAQLEATRTENVTCPEEARQSNDGQLSGTHIAQRCRWLDEGEDAGSMPYGSHLGPGMLAVAKGEILQWCNVSNVGKHICCDMDLTKFLDANLSAIGISSHAPLTISITGNPESRLSVGAKQPEAVLSEASYSRLGLDFLVPYAVNLYLASNAEGGSSSNIFLGMMQRMAWYLSNLNLICCICQKRSFVPSSNVQSCQDNPCLATFNAWVHVAPLVPWELISGFQERWEQIAARLEGMNWSEQELRLTLVCPEPNNQEISEELIRSLAQLSATTQSTERLVPRTYFSPPGFVEVPFQEPK